MKHVLLISGRLLLRIDLYDKLTLNDSKHIQLGQRKSINLMMIEKRKYMIHGLYVIFSVSLGRSSVLAA